MTNRVTNRVTENNRHVTVDVTLNDLNETEKDVYNLIKDNPKITRDEMALKINKTIRTIQRITNSLVSKGYIYCELATTDLVIGRY